VHHQHTKCTPQGEQESILGHFLLGGRDLEVHLVLLDRLLRATSKKRSSTFLRKKVHTCRQNPGYAYAAVAGYELTTTTVTNPLLTVPQTFEPASTASHSAIGRESARPERPAAIDDDDAEKPTC